MQRVLVLGVPRSGTTWIGQALGRCAGARYVHEPDGVHDPFAYRARVAMAPLVALGRLDDAPPDYRRLWSGAFAGGQATRSLRDRAARRLYAAVTTAQRADAREGKPMVWRLRAAIALAQPRGADPGAEAVVVKSVDAALSCEWIVAQFAPAVVLVRRDLRSVLSSWVALGMSGPRPAGYAAIVGQARRRWGVELPDYGDSPLLRGAAVCATWAAALEDARGRHPDWLTVAHEDVCRAPSAQLAGAAAAAGLRWTDAADEFLRASDVPGEGYAVRRVAAQQPGAWRQRLDAEQIAAVETVVACFPPELLGAGRHQSG